jgi:hypothetical protein
MSEISPLRKLSPCPPRTLCFLMYHELELAGRKLCQSEPGYVRYILPLEAFRSRWPG